MRKNDLTGQRFGRLVVLKQMPNNASGKVTWLCKCDCGNEKAIIGSLLHTGKTRSCGCLIRESTTERSTKHGYRASKKHLYGTRLNMIDRCTNPKNKTYDYYGGRGIKVCKEWLNKETGVAAFCEWALANGYAEGMTIDRIDVNGDYSPDNCRFVDYFTQGSNKRNNRLITHNGETKTQSEWARHYGKNRAFFCGPEELIERRMSGCDAYMRKFGKVPPRVHCVRRNA